MLNFNYSIQETITPLSLSPPVSPRKVNSLPVSPYKNTEFPHSPSQPNPFAYNTSPRSSPTKVKNYAKEVLESDSIPLSNQISQESMKAPSSPMKGNELSLGKRSYQSVNDENLSPQSPLKKPSLNSNATIQKLLMLTPAHDHFDHDGWITTYEDVKQHNLSNIRLLEAIKAEPNSIKRQIQMHKLVELKLSVCCLAWSILPQFDLLKKFPHEGYFSPITLAFFEHAVNEFFKDEAIPENFKEQIRESFSQAVSNHYPIPATIIKNWQLGKPVFLSAGWRGHVTCLLVYKNFVVYGNKGDQHPSFNFSGLKYYLMSNPANFNEEFIEKVHSGLTNTKRIGEKKDFFENNKMAELLGLVPFYQERMKPQNGQYCTNTVCTMNLRSLSFLLALNNAGNVAINNDAPISQQCLDYKKIKKFNRVYDLTQVGELLSHPEIKDLVGSKDIFKLCCNLHNKLSIKKYNDFSPAQQKQITIFFQTFHNYNPLKIDDCITTFDTPYQESNKIMKMMLQNLEPGAFSIRLTTINNILIVNYVDSKRQVRFFKIKKINQDYIYGKRTISSLQELMSSKEGELLIPYMDSINQKNLSNSTFQTLSSN